MRKLRPCQNSWYSFWCPGCKGMHAIPTLPAEGGWTWNGSLDAPTFFPSIAVNCNPKYPNPTAPRCHFFVTDGRIHFCGDCSHELSNQVVEMKPV